MRNKRYYERSHADTKDTSDADLVESDCLDLPGYRFIRKLSENAKRVRMLAEVANPITVCPYPGCGSMEKLGSHGSFRMEFDDWGNGKRRLVKIDHHRWMCLRCKKTCSDGLPGLDPDFKATRRLIESVEQRIDQRDTYSAIAVHTRLSLATIRRIATRLMKNRPTDMLIKAPVEAGFDEKHFRKKLIFVMTRSKLHQPWEALPDTSNATVERCFASITNREDLLVANMDFTLTTKGLVIKWFPNATIVIDPFHVSAKLLACVPAIRKEEGRRLKARVLADLEPKLRLLSDDKKAKDALRKQTQRLVNRQISRLKRDRSLFEIKRWELGRADRLKVETWLDDMPLLKEFWDFLQNLYRLYRHRTTPKTAEALLTRWLNRLSPDALKHMKKFANIVRKHMTDVCAFWTTRSSNGYTEAVNKTFEDIARNRGRISFARLRDLYLYSHSPTSILQEQRAERQEQRAPSQKHASVRPVRRLRGDIERMPERKKRRRRRRQRAKSGLVPHADQLEFFPLETLLFKGPTG